VWKVTISGSKVPVNVKGCQFSESHVDDFHALTISGDHWGCKHGSLITMIQVTYAITVPMVRLAYFLQ
jgi:hypothetical protein